jgi:SAM-dependent methyltransferase
MGISKPILELVNGAVHDPAMSLQILKRLRFAVRGHAYSGPWAREPAAGESAQRASKNHLEAYFQSHTEGRGIWKWLHYFDIYQRHLERFVGQEVHVVEVGIYSGGSLDMWKHYFGPKCRIVGVDIEPACKAYADERTRIFIGDQADRGFWRGFKREVPEVDVFIDDGGHHPEQQIATLEEMLPHLRPGGVYLCEDIHGTRNGFSAYVRGMADNLNAQNGPPLGQELGFAATPFQRAIHSFHFYPYVCVIERHAAPPEALIAPKHGTEWQPFL